jgi:hypothetical protein
MSIPNHHDGRSTTYSEGSVAKYACTFPTLTPLASTMPALISTYVQNVRRKEVDAVDIGSDLEWNIIGRGIEPVEPGADEWCGDIPAAGGEDNGLIGLVQEVGERRG